MKQKLKYIEGLLIASLLYGFLLFVFAPSSSKNKKNHILHVKGNYVNC